MLAITLLSVLAAVLPSVRAQWGVPPNAPPPSSGSQDYCGCDQPPPGAFRRSKASGLSSDDQYCVDTNPNGVTRSGDRRDNCNCSAVNKDGIDPSNNFYKNACDCTGYLVTGFPADGSVEWSSFKPACGRYDWWTATDNSAVA